MSHPDGKPSLVKPVLDKIDVDGLKRDLTKFREHYPEQAFSFWSEWVNNVNDMATVPETWEWPLDALVLAERIKHLAESWHLFRHYVSLFNFCTLAEQPIT